MAYWAELILRKFEASMSVASPPSSFASALRDTGIAILIAAVLLLPLLGFRTVDGGGGLMLENRLDVWWQAVAMVAAGRFLSRITTTHPVRGGLAALIATSLIWVIPFADPMLRVIGSISFAVISLMTLRQPLADWSSQFITKKATTLKPSRTSLLDRATLGLVLLGLILPWLPLTDRYALDVVTMILIYAALAYGLNIVVGYTGLLDLGYVAFYAIGAYATALLGQKLGFSFWQSLPIAAVLPVVIAGAIGTPILRLRGDYLAIVTLGLAEITRLVLMNTPKLTGGPNGISDVPRPSFFGLNFGMTAEEPRFHEALGLEFDPLQRLIYLYYLLLFLVIGISWLGWALRRLPLGRGWEAAREDEIACAALGMDRARLRLVAYCLSAACAGLCGAFFAAKQGFISPESFGFSETATILAIVVLGGVGHPLGIVLAAAFIIGMPELFRELEDYRMLAFGAGMVAIMIWRPGGLMATRIPAISKARTD
jgi:branched-chain amino acid transport system permease protein